DGARLGSDADLVELVGVPERLEDRAVKDRLDVDVADLTVSEDDPDHVRGSGNGGDDVRRHQGRGSPGTRGDSAWILDQFASSSLRRSSHHSRMNRSARGGRSPFAAAVALMISPAMYTERRYLRGRRNMRPARTPDGEDVLPPA